MSGRRLSSISKPKTLGKVNMKTDKLKIQRNFPDDDFERFLRKKMAGDPIFKKEFEEGYDEFMIGAMIASARQKAGLTQEELARKAHTTKSAICRWERQPSNIRIGNLQRIAKALGLHLHVKLA